MFRRSVEENASWLNSLTPKIKTETDRLQTESGIAGENAKSLLANKALLEGHMVGSIGLLAKSQETTSENVLVIKRTLDNLARTLPEGQKDALERITGLQRDMAMTMINAAEDRKILQELSENVKAMKALLDTVSGDISEVKRGTKEIVCMSTFMMEQGMRTHALITKMQEVFGKQLNDVHREIKDVGAFLRVSCVLNFENFTQAVYSLLKCIYQFICYCYVILKAVLLFLFEVQVVFTRIASTSFVSKLPERYRGHNVENVISTLLYALQLYFLCILTNMFGSIFGMERIGTRTASLLLETILTCLSYLKELCVSFLTDPTITSSVKVYLTTMYLNLGNISNFIMSTGSEFVSTGVFTGGEDTDIEPVDDRYVLNQVGASVQDLQFKLLDIIHPKSKPDISNISKEEMQQIVFVMNQFMGIANGKKVGGVRVRTKSRRKLKKVRKTRK